MTMTTEKEEYKVYFYNGFEKPKLLSVGLKGLMDVVISDNYLGDKTEDFQEDISYYCENEDKLWDFEIDELKEEIGYYDMLINPSVEDLLDESRRYFSENDLPLHHFTDFESMQELKFIANRMYDDFKTYEGYENMFIVENYIRYTYFNTVILSSESISDCEQYLDDNDLWDDCILLGVDSKGRAYYPQF